MMNDRLSERNVLRLVKRAAPSDTDGQGCVSVVTAGHSVWAHASKAGGTPNCCRPFVPDIGDALRISPAG